MFDLVVFVGETDPDRVAANFRLAEFRCPCCGGVRVNPGFIRLVAGLQRMRDILGAPLTVTSGYRCPAHNRQVGGEPDSRHVAGDGADVRAPVPYARLVEAAERVFGGGGIGTYQDGHVHVDWGPRRRWAK